MFTEWLGKQAALRVMGYPEALAVVTPSLCDRKEPVLSLVRTGGNLTECLLFPPTFTLFAGLESIPSLCLPPC